MDRTWSSNGSPATLVDGRGPSPFLGSVAIGKEGQNPAWFLDRMSRAHLDPMPPLHPTEDNLRAGLKTKYTHLRGAFPSTYERLAKGVSRQGPPPSWPDVFAAGDSRGKLASTTASTWAPRSTSAGAWAPRSTNESFFSGYGTMGAGSGGWAEDKASRALLCRSLSASSTLAPLTPPSSRGRSSGGRSSGGRGRSDPAGVQDGSGFDEAELLRSLRRAKGKPRDPWFGNLRINPDVIEKVG